MLHGGPQHMAHQARGLPAVAPIATSSVRKVKVDPRPLWNCAWVAVAWLLHDVTANPLRRAITSNVAWPGHGVASRAAAARGVAPVVSASSRGGVRAAGPSDAMAGGPLPFQVSIAS